MGLGSETTSAPPSSAEAKTSSYYGGQSPLTFILLSQLQNRVN